MRHIPPSIHLTRCHPFGFIYAAANVRFQMVQMLNSEEKKQGILFFQGLTNWNLQTAININLEKEKVSQGATQCSYLQELRVLGKDYNLPDLNLPAATDTSHVPRTTRYQGRGGTIEESISGSFENHRALYTWKTGFLF